MFPPKAKNLKKILVVSDTQSGSRLSPIDPAFRLPDGGGWRLNRGQLYLWEKWENMLDLLPKQLDGFVHLGEMVQGPASQKDSTTELLTNDKVEQAAIAENLIGPLVDRVERHSSGKGKAFWVCRASGWHEGPYGKEADVVAKNLGAQNFPNGEQAGDVLDLPIGPFVLNLAHHHPVFLRYKTSALERELQWFSEGEPQVEQEDGTPIEDYDLVVRGHVHRYDMVDTGLGMALSCPGWQLATRYVKVKSIARSWPHIGFVVIYLDPETRRNGWRGIWPEVTLYPHPRRKAAKL